MNTISKTLSDFIVGTNIDAIPKEAIKVAKMAIMDTLGVILCASSEEPIGSLLVNFAQEIGGRQEARIIGKGLKCNSPTAAMINGILAHYLDYDDVCFPMRGHPSAAILPAILALGEKKMSSGKEILESYVVGFEIMAKLGSKIALEHSEKGWHSTGTLGAIGAAAASAKILNLNVKKTMMTLGIVASKASGLRQNFGTMTKSLHAGNAAKNGVEAAMLAELGLTSSKNIWEGHFGFLDLFVGEGKYNSKRIIEDIGNFFSIISPGIVLKRYPSCSSTHAAIDIMLKLINTYDITPENVKSIECGVNYRVPQDLLYHEPKTGLQGKFSMEFCIAIVVLEKKLGIDQFQDVKVKDSRVQNLMKKVRMYVPPELQRRDKVDDSYTIITVELLGGQKYSLKLDNTTIKGFPNNPLSREELLEKYWDCANYSRITEKQINHSIELIEHLEQVENITELMDTLGKNIKND